MNYMYNGHGDVTALVDSATGTVEAAYYYDAFGNVVNALIRGDVNGDGIVTSTDYAIVQRYCQDMPTEFPSPFGKLAADVDGDNNITDTDLAYIQKKILGMIEYFPADTNKDCYTDSKNPYGYAGYQYDRETGLYYLNARMYDPVTARFLQEDTYTGDTNDPLSLNLYTYCHNEPVLCFLRGTNKKHCKQ